MVFFLCSGKILKVTSFKILKKCEEPLLPGFITSCILRDWCNLNLKKGVGGESQPNYTLQWCCAASGRPARHLERGSAPSRGELTGQRREGWRVIRHKIQPEEGGPSSARSWQYCPHQAAWTQQARGQPQREIWVTVV